MTTTGNALITITTTLAAAVGRIAERHSGAIEIGWDDEHPENVWTVEAYDDDIDNRATCYLVDDESGTIDPWPAVDTPDELLRDALRILGAGASRYDDMREVAQRINAYLGR